MSTRRLAPFDQSTAAIPVRLVSSVAVVGRDNEPIYLRGDLCDTSGGDSAAASTAPAIPSTATVKAAEGAGEEGDVSKTGGEGGSAESIGGEDEGGDDGGSSSTGSTPGRGGKKGLLGRLKGAVAVGMSKNTEGSAENGGHHSANENRDAWDVEGEGEDDDDPFGFFGSEGESGDLPATSLTRQLVLHASLDRFEEMASRSNRGGAVRWRTPGSNAANAMWMGLLCEVEERWNVYGYLTNTGIKFMILVENVYINRDGSRHCKHDHAPPTFSDYVLPHSLSSSSNNREVDLKNMFAQLHELYVRYTLNPFSRLRGPIRSRSFDGGIVLMARQFNDAALGGATSKFGGKGRSGPRDGLVWM